MDNSDAVGCMRMDVILAWSFGVAQHVRAKPMVPAIGSRRISALRYRVCPRRADDRYGHFDDGARLNGVGRTLGDSFCHCHFYRIEAGPAGHPARLTSRCRQVKAHYTLLSLSRAGHGLRYRTRRTPYNSSNIHETRAAGTGDGEIAFASEQ